MSPIEQSIKAKIEKIGTPLKDWDINIYRGVLTGFNDAFIISGEKRDEILANCKNKIERKKTAELIRPILRGRDIKRFSYTWADLWLIYIPWHFPLQFDQTIQGASKKAEDEFQKQYPSVYAHLLSYKKELSARNKAETGIRYEWYAMQRWGSNYWDDFNKPVIAWQRITAKNQFCLTTAGTIILDSMAFLSNLGKYEKYLLAILNSSLVYYWVKKNVHEYGATGFRLSNQYVEQITVPKPDSETLQKFNVLVEQYLKNTKNLREIDSEVYKLYKLSTDDVEVIEKTLL